MALVGKKYTRNRKQRTIKSMKNNIHMKQHKENMALTGYRIPIQKGITKKKHTGRQMQQISQPQKPILSSAKKNMGSTQYKHKNRVQTSKLDAALTVNFRRQVATIISALQPPMSLLLI